MPQAYVPWLRLAIDFRADSSLLPWRRGLDGGAQSDSASVDKVVFKAMVDACWLSS